MNLIKLLVLFVLSIISVNLVQGFSLQSFMEGKGNDFDKDELLDNYSTSSFGGNIYSSSHNLISQTHFQSQKKGLEYVYEFMSSSYGCSISQEDIYNIYGVANPMFVYIQSGLSGREKIQSDTEQFIESCKKVAECVGSDNASEIDGYTQGTRDICTGIVTNIYNDAQRSIYVYESSNYVNYGDDIFMNGTLDDSPYDLLVDIKNIGDVMFFENEENEEVFFYNNNSSGTGGAGGGTGGSGTGGGTGGAGGGTGGSGTGGGTGGAGGGTGGSGTGGGTGGTEGDGTSAPIGTGGVGIINNFMCSVDGDNGTGGTGGDGNGGQLTDSEMIQIDIDGILDSHDGVVNSHNDIIQQLTEFIPSDDVDYGDISGSIDNFIGNMFGDPEEAGDIDYDTLVGTIGGMSAGNCMNAGDPDSIFWIRVCMVFTETKGIVDQKVIDATQEALDEINNVLLNLKRSGAIMKHKKTDEAREIGLQDINFGEIFSFDFVIRTKPIFPGYGSHQQEIRKVMLFETNKKLEENILNMHDSLDLQAEKNKYIIRGNPERLRMESTPMPTVGARSESLAYSRNYENQIDPDYERIMSDIQNSSNYKNMDFFNYFIEFNINWWDQMNTTLYAIEHISRGFKRRVVTGSGG